MFYPPNFLLVLLVTSNYCNATIHLGYGRQTLPRTIPDSSFTSFSNQIATATSLQTHYGSHNTYSASIISPYTQNVKSSFTALPVPFYNNSVDENNGYPKNVKNYEDIKSGFCELTDNFCSFKEKNGTITEAKPTNMDDQCVLWDDSCSGNKTLAMEKFFNIAFPSNHTGIMENDCFAQRLWASQPDCETYNSPERLSEWQKIKDWMRSPDCVSDAEEWLNMTGKFWGWIFTGGENVAKPNTDYELRLHDPSCCQLCELQVQNVDLYYWPEPDVDQSCLSIIGGSVRPLNYSATFSSYSMPAGPSPSPWTLTTDTYWGCNGTEPLFPFTGFSDLVTASVTTLGGLTVKVPLLSPWESSPCVENNVGSQGSNGSIKNRDRQASVRARDHSLIVASSLTQKEGSPVTTVSGDFTFTSPSIYANFHGLSVSDPCGTSTIKSLMLSFSVGELSSLEGNLGMFVDLSTKPFDFRDLPCPPQRVMEANWYKPEPGEPYRPLIAMPSKINQQGGWLKYCAGEIFTAYDPPHALVTEAALLPPTAAGDPKAAPAPSPTQDPSAGATVAGKGSTLQPAIIPTVDQPKATKSPGSISNDGSTSSDPQSKDPAAQNTSPSESAHSPSYYKQGSDTTQGSIPSQGSGSKEDSDPNKGSNHKQGDSDPNQGSDPNQDGNPNDVNPAPGTDPNKSYLLTQTLTALTGYRYSNSDVDTIAPSDPNQSDTASLVGEDSGQDVPPVNTLKTSTSPDPFNNPALASKEPTQPFIFPDPFNSFAESQSTTINHQAVQKLPHGISVAGTMLTPGAPPITSSGTPIAYGPSVIVVGTSTISLAFSEQKSITTGIAGQAITIGQNAVAIAGTTLTPGASAITVSGTSMSLGSSALFIGTSTISLTSGPSEHLVTTVAGHAVTVAPNAVEEAGTTLHPGVPSVTLELIVGSTTMALPSDVAGLGGLIVQGLERESASDASELLTTIVVGQAITADPTAVAFAGSTLTPGAPGRTIDGTLVSLNTASELVVGSKTITLTTESVKAGGLSGISDPIITIIAGQAITAAPNAITFAGTTLTPGAPGKTINGTLVSLNTAGQLVAGSKTIPLATENAELGGLIMGGFGKGGPLGATSTSHVGGNSSSGNGNGTRTSTSVKVFRGGVEKVKGGVGWMMGGCLMVVVVVVGGV